MLNFLSLVAVTTTTALSSPNLTTLGIIPGSTGHYVTAGDHRYYYQESNPTNSSLGTILLLHGFPDFSYTWRHQAPYLTSLGYRVIAPDLIGYANTDSPLEISNWAFKKQSSDIASLLDQIAPGEQIILGGHDWGAGLAYGFATWHPEYLKAFFTLSVPYSRPWFGPTLGWVDMLDLVQNGTYPTLGYQIQWRDPAMDRNFTTEDDVRSFLNAGFGAVTAEGVGGLAPQDGIHYDVLPQLGNQSLVSAEDFEIHVKKISQKGMRGAFNWYRTRRMNWEDELGLAVEWEAKGGFRFRTPHLFVPAEGDFFMPPELYKDYGRYFEDLTVEGVEAGHWSQWEKPDEVNAILGKWIEGL
jgi:pimeloyl-ACP methyl ester carboxylesterase